MKSRTLFCNGTALRKDMTRFAPVWVLYTVFLLLCLMGIYRDEPGPLARNIIWQLESMSVVNLLYALVCAAVLFGDLFVPRLCNALHTLPLRRGSWFRVHVLAGFLFALIPSTLAAGLAAAVLQEYWYMAVIWLVLTMLEYLLFFGVAVFCVMCVGNRLALFGVYGLFSFLSYLVYYLTTIFYEPLLYGVVVDEGLFSLFCPVVQLARNTYVLSEYGKPEGFTFLGFHEFSWIYLGICAVLGIVLLMVARLLYRRRKLECAGDFIAFRPMAPVFLTVYTLGVGALLYTAGEIFNNDLRYPFLIVGLVMGFFTGKMLLERRVNVFNLRTFLGFLLLAALLAGSVVAAWLDPLGITTYVPSASRVESVEVHTGYAGGYYDYTGIPGAQVTDPAQISRICSLHGTMLQDTEENGNTVRITLRYTLKTGIKMSRTYFVPMASATGEDVRELLGSWQTVLQVFDKDWETAKAGPWECTQYPKEVLPGLLEAIRADCEAGTMAQDWAFHGNEDILEWITLLYYGDDPENGTYLEIRVYSCCANTIAYLKENNLLSEQMDKFVTE